MHKFKLLCLIIRRSGAGKPLAGFVTTFLVCALILWLIEPSVQTFGDAIWFLWAVSLTVGLGDITAVTLVGRVVTIICSLYAVITMAIITAVVVDYFHERRQEQLNESLSLFMDKLERLPELSDEELRDMSAKVKDLRRQGADKSSAVSVLGKQ